MPGENDNDDLTLAEAARMLGVSPTTLERWATAGRIASRLTADGRRTFRRQDLLTTSARHRPEEREAEH